MKNEEREGIMMKKRRLAALALACVMALTTGCSGGGGSTAGSTAGTEAKTEAGTKEEAKAADTGSGEKITLKIANYAVLEKGYDEFWI